VTRNFFELGVGQVLFGLYHVCFLAALMLIARDARRIALVVTAFTLACVVAIALAVFGLVRLPAGPTSAVIALSILFLARVVLMKKRDTLVHRYTLACSAGFGLLHGFGLAAALTVSRLAGRNTAVALLQFALGIAAGQVAFILAAVATFALLAKFTLRSDVTGDELPAAFARIAAYLIGIPAAYAFLQRLPWLAFA
jgi:HupE / UreJ protein